MDYDAQRQHNRDRLVTIGHRRSADGGPERCAKDEVQSTEQNACKAAPSAGER
jgi:hypothetical protein